MTFADLDSSGTVDIVLVLKNNQKHEFHYIPNNFTQIENLCENF